jgi:HK97 family phage portal protein
MGFDLDRAVAAQQEGKALGYHPGFSDGTPTTVYSPGQPRTDAKITKREAKRHAEAYGGVEAIDHVYDAIGLYADPAGSAPYHLEKEDGTKLVHFKTKGTPPDHEVGPEDLYQLLRKPNPFMLYKELMSLLVIDLMLTGDAYWYKLENNAFNQPKQLYRLCPAYVSIIPGKLGPKRYEYQPPGVKDPLKIEPVDLIHFKRPNPHSAYHGMGVIQGGGRAMDLELSVTDTMASYYENKADPSMIVQSERRVPRDVFNKLRAQLRARASGSKKAGELLVLEAGLTATSLSTTAADAMFDKLSKMTRDRIYAKFRASAKLFGLLDDAGGTDKIADARREFDNYALRPFLDGIQDAITDGLTKPGWDVNHVIDYRTLLPAEDAVKVGGEIAKIPGIKVRELRRMYAQFGIDESTGDPEIDEFVLNMPGPEMDEDGMIVDPVTGKRVAGQSVKAADRPLPGEPGRPPKGENTRGFGSTAGKALTIAEIEARLTEMGAGKALNTAGEHVQIGNKLENEQRPDDPFASARKVDIDAAMGSIAAQLRDAAHTLERGLLDTMEGKALKTSDIVKRVQQSQAWASFKERVTAILEEGARTAAISGVMHSGKVPEEDIDYDDIAKTIVHRPDGVRSILATIKKRVSNKIKETRERDGERGDYESAIRAAINDWTSSQVVTIADSEATEAYNEAVLTAFELSGEDQVYVEDGDDHDEPCAEANGSVWNIDYARQHRKEHPRCRRAFLSLAEVS